MAGKRSKLICFKVSEEMEIDLMRAACVEDKTMSAFMYDVAERELYGRMVKVRRVGGQAAAVDQVDQSDE